MIIKCSYRINNESYVKPDCQITWTTQITKNATKNQTDNYKSVCKCAIASPHNEKWRLSSLSVDNSTHVTQL